MKFRDFRQKVAGEAIGLHKLIDTFSLPVSYPTVRSEVVRGARRTRITDGTVLEQYPPTYAPTEVFGHLRFAMRYEPIDLSVLDALFKAVERTAFEDWIKTEPVGKYARRAWYLYELLTGQALDIPDVPPTGNVMLLNPALHITAKGRYVRRQRVVDNLLGNKAYCPMIRRSDKLIAVAPHLRAKGADAVVQQLLADDAVPATRKVAAISDRGMRRLFDRLVALGAVRELTGRATFRLYGL